MTAAKIGSAFAGPWAAFAVSAVLLAVDVNDGVTAGKHALMQGAVGFASGMTGGLGGLAVNVAASGIDYESDGSIGWDNDKFREGAIRSVASYALSAALGGALDAKNSTLGAGLSSGLSSGLMNGVQITSTGWGDLDLDYDKANWREHLVVGAAAGISTMVNKAMNGKGQSGSEGSQYGNENGTTSYPEQWGNQFSQKVITGGINSLIMTAAYHAMDGEGFKNDYSKMNWQNMTYSAYDLGNFLGSETNSFVKEYAKNHSEKLGGIRNNAENTIMDGKTPEHDPSWLDMGMQGLATALEYSDKGDAALKGLFGKIGEYGVKGIAGLGSLVADGLGAAWEGVMGLFESSPTITNDFAELMKKDPSMQRWVVEMMYRDKEFAKMADDLGLDPEMKKLGVFMEKRDTYNERIQQVTAENKNNKGWFTVFHDSEQAADYIMTKKYFGEKIDSKDAELLMRTLWQANDKPLAQEFATAILNNKDLFKDQKGLDVKDLNSINSFANSVAGSSCFLNTLFGNLVLSPLMENIPTSMGDMYKTLYEKGMIDSDGVSANININDLSGIQKLVDTVVGENKLSVEGFSINQGLSTSKVNDALEDLINNNPSMTGGVRINGHSILFFDGMTCDTGQPGNPYGPRPYGSDITKYAKPANTNSLYYLKSY